MRYDSEQAIGTNTNQNFSWFLKAAETGSPRAQYNLGRMYQDGIGVMQDCEKAASWLSKAAVQGDADAQYNLGMMYARGEGVQQDDWRALDWLRLAAEKGHADAQYMVGETDAGGERGTQPPNDTHGNPSYSSLDAIDKPSTISRPPEQFVQTRVEQGNSNAETIASRSHAHRKRVIEPTAHAQTAPNHTSVGPPIQPEKTTPSPEPFVDIADTGSVSFLDVFIIQDRESCAKAIKYGAIAAMVIAGFSGLIGISSFLVASDNQIAKYILDPLLLVDAVLAFILGIFVFRKSRIASTILVVYFLGAKAAFFYDTGKLPGIISIIYLLLFITAMRATYIWHARYEDDNESQHYQPNETSQGSKFSPKVRKNTFLRKITSPISIMFLTLIVFLYYPEIKQELNKFITSKPEERRNVTTTTPLRPIVEPKPLDQGQRRPLLNTELRKIRVTVDSSLPGGDLLNVYNGNEDVAIYELTLEVRGTEGRHFHTVDTTIQPKQIARQYTHAKGHILGISILDGIVVAPQSRR